MAGNVEIDTVYVKVQITHSYASDLQLFLVAPDGTEFGLFLNEGGSSLLDAGLTWTFAVELARGYSSAAPGRCGRWIWWLAMSGPSAR
ncbi:MAG: proprotein convertase P-domain-containing protein [Exiguobacterium profundum]|nr:MAG: proprotein convertase P-domain-containing protein [Exiguobacterium profundum]